MSDFGTNSKLCYNKVRDIWGLVIGGLAAFTMEGLLVQKCEHPVVTAGQTGTYVATRARNVRYNDKINEDFFNRPKHTPFYNYRCLFISMYNDYAFL